MPTFRRPIFTQLLRDTVELRQIISLTGPRRVGKTTLVLQLVQQLLAEGFSPQRILYLQLDDPVLHRVPERPRLLDALVERFFDVQARRPLSGVTSPVFILLDEVQRFDDWELHLKKYFDLDLPIRWLVTGSASSPIFRQSRESLLGRIKQHHVLPFSYREYALFAGGARLEGQAAISSAPFTKDEALAGLDGAMLVERATELHAALGNDRALLGQLFRTYLLRGGFPEAWAMEEPVRRQEYLFDNQVQKVVFDDLVAATHLRKPENVLRFYLYLITRPGEEIRVDAVAREIGADRRSLEKYLRLLELTDLVRTIPNFSRKPLRAKRTNLKAYLVDLGVRNAVLKLDDRLFDDSALLGRYAENLVYRTALGWREMLELSYYRQRDREVDFVATLAPDRYLPIEVKYASRPRRAGFLGDFTRDLHQGLAVAIQRDVAPAWRAPVAELGLLDFLLIFG